MNPCKRILISCNNFRNLRSSSASKVSRTFLTQPQEDTSRHKVVNEAEKVVGYPISFLSLRWLLNDEIANIVSHIRKLIGTNHPLIATARDLIISREIPTWGLIVLLISKAGGLPQEVLDVDKDTNAGILHSQRVLAEVTEMIRTSNILHNSILNITTKDKEEYNSLNFGNTLSLLSGDFLLSNSFRELAGLRNQEVNELVSTCLRDLVEAEFIGPRDKQSRPLPAKPVKTQKRIEIPNEFGTSPLKIEEVLGNAKAEWTLRHFLGSASLLAKCCQASLKLANHPEDFQKLGYLFGRNMALAWRTNFDLESFQDDRTGHFSLISAPVLFHLQHQPGFYDEILKGSEDIFNCDYEKIRKAVKSGPGISMTEDLKQEFVNNSLEVLHNFDESDAKKALVNIVKVL